MRAAIWHDKIFHIICVLTFLCCKAERERSKVVQRLENDLFQRYNRDVIPKQFLNEGVRVKLDLALNQIIDVNKRAQTLKAVIWVRQYWNDPRLKWNVTQYGGVKTIVMHAARIWLPDITLYNNARDDYKIEKENEHSLSISSNGAVSRFFPTIYKSSCSLNIRYFPFDDQVCPLKLGSWSYNLYELNLTTLGNGDLNTFIPNGEWTLKGMPAERHVITFRCCPHPYVYLLYHIKIRRRSLYYVINCFTPCFIMLGLTILGFYLPSDSGERMGVGITVLLSLSIIQLMLSDSLPPNEEIPLIVRYYGLTMFNIFLSLVYTCIVLKLYHNEPQPLPHWVRLLLCHWGAWVVRLREEWRKIQEKRKTLESGDKHLCSNNTTDVLASKYSQVSCSPSGETISQVTSESVAGRAGHGKNVPTPSKFEQFIINQYRKEDQIALHKEEWRFASKVLNTLFKWTIIASIMINSCIAFMGAPIENLIDWVPKG